MIDCPRCEGLGAVCTYGDCSHPEDEDCPVDCEHVKECPECHGTGKQEREP